MGIGPIKEPDTSVSFFGTFSVKNHGGEDLVSFPMPSGLRIDMLDMSLSESAEISICIVSPGATTVPAEGRMIETPSDELDRKSWRPRNDASDWLAEPRPWSAPIFSFVQIFFACSDAAVALLGDGLTAGGSELGED